jgi:hypothetical protein
MKQSLQRCLTVETVVTHPSAVMIAFPQAKRVHAVGRIARELAQRAMAAENMSARSEHSDRPDYSGLMGQVALALLGEPITKRRGGREWRYGTYGSLSIDLLKNAYFDHEAGQGRGVLDLSVREKGDDHADVVECLDANDTRITPDARRSWQAPHCGAAYG